MNPPSLYNITLISGYTTVAPTGCGGVGKRPGQICTLINLIVVAVSHFMGSTLYRFIELISGFTGNIIHYKMESPFGFIYQGVMR